MLFTAVPKAISPTEQEPPCCPPAQTRRVCDGLTTAVCFHERARRGQGSASTRAGAARSPRDPPCAGGASPLHSGAAALPPGHGARRPAQQPRGGGAALRAAPLPPPVPPFRRETAAIGPSDAVHRGVRIRALPARDGLRAGGARAALPLLAVHLQRRVRGPGRQRAGRGTLGPGGWAQGRAGLGLPRLTAASPRCAARFYPLYGLLFGGKERQHKEELRSGLP